MPYTVGIDLGTTFTSAAVGDAAGTRIVPLSPDIVVPSLAYHSPGGTLLTGAAAQDAGAEPGRLARGFKRRLGDPTPLTLGGAIYSPAALMAAQLRTALDHVTSTMGGPPASVVLTYPAIWGPYRREQFTEVPRLTGVDDVQLITEPEAAATHYSRERALGDGEVVAVYDLGGGTLDTTVLRMRAGEMEILGTPEGIEHLGGTDFDDALLAHLDARLDGAITDLDPADPTAFAALTRIRALCVQAKIELSTEPDVTLTVPLQSGPRELTITRREFNTMIRPSVELTIGALKRTVASAGLRGDDLSAVLLAGGSSRVPLVTQLVFEAFDKPMRLAQHPKFTVALGAAAAGARTLTTVPTTVAAPQTEPTRGRPHRARWLVPAAAVALAAVVALVILMVKPLNPAVESAPDSPASTTTTAGPKPLVMFDGGPVNPYRTFIASPDNWQGDEVVEQTASRPAITANTADGLRVTWSGSSPGQVYLQTGNAARDLSSYVDSSGALSFDVLVHEKPQGTIKLATHCVHPCGAELNVTDMFRRLPVGQQRTITVPLHCFTAKGLEKTMVNTPFLLYSEGSFDSTFRNIAWVPNAAKDPNATPCDAVS